jgi:peptide/nickel transport system substrate-binding protein
MKFKNYTGNVGGKSQLFTEFEYVNDINILDDYTFKVSYKLPFARTIDIWINSIIPRHIFENYKTLEEFTQSTYNRNPVGTGKYKFSLWQPDERIILERNNNYHGKSAYIDKIIYSVNPEQAILYLDTRLGRNDVAEFTPTQFGRLLKNNEDLEKIMPVKYTGNHYMYMGYNLKNPLLSNPEIRKALTMAINRQEIIDGVLEGYGQVCYGPFYPFSWAFNKELNPTPYSPVDAMKIFQDFGWEDTNQDGWLDKNGKIFEFKVMVDRSEPNRNMALKFIQRNLKNIGVKLEIEPVEWNILVNNLYTKNFDAVLVGWQLSLDPDIYSVWHTDGPMNFISYSNPRVDELLERARKTFDRDIRRESYNQVHRLIKNDMPYTFLYIDEVLGAVNRRIKGVETKNTGLNSVAEWYVNYRTVIY